MVRALTSVVFCVILSSFNVYAIQLPPEIHKCDRTAPDFNECMVKSIGEATRYFSKGSKDFGYPVLSPFRIERLEINGEPGKSVTLNQKYDNVVMYGMTESTVKSFSLKDDGGVCLWELVIHTPYTRMEADYQMTGQILVFPINGHGRCNVTLTGIVNKHTADCEHYTKKGKSHMKLKNYKMDMSTEGAYFDFENIFPGNEQISKEVGKTINENSQEVFNDVKQGFEKILAELHQNAANSVFSKIPENELFVK
ncbi:protein takeout-like [Sitophilus oryzae]|uniref:Protein takeout-like n=1 Tax=Sitophilus oryzae TaxID=7048 RepID=A0A6J2X9I1_SITOR|nr:protein takeout-like [Sitophilus oryzae]